MSDSDRAGMSVGVLREALVSAMDLGGAFGANLHESKAVLIQVGDEWRHLGKVKVSFHNGSFVLVLEAGDREVPL